MRHYPPIDQRHAPPPHRQRDPRSGGSGGGYERVYQHPDDHHPEAIFVNVPGRSSTDINRINMPIAMVVVAAIFLMGTTWVA